MSQMVVLTSDEIDQVERLAPVLNQQQIADYLGIDADTFTAIKKRDAEVARRYKKGKSKAVGKMGSSLLQKGFNGDTTAMIFYLKTQAGWKEKTDPAIIVNVPKSLDDFYADNETES